MRTASIGSIALLVVLLSSACSGGDGGAGPDPTPIDRDSAVVVASTGPSPAHLAIGGGQLYWTESSLQPIQRLNTATGAVQPIAYRMGPPLDAEAAGDDVIWLDDAPFFAFQAVRTLHRTTAAGTTSVLATLPPALFGAPQLEIADGFAYFVAGSSSPVGEYAVVRVPLAGGAVANLYQTRAEIVALSVRNGFVYWFEGRQYDSTAAIRRVPTGGGAVTTVAGDLWTGVRCFAVNDAYVFYSRLRSDGDILEAVDPGGGSPHFLSMLTRSPTRMVASPSTVYWLDGGTVSGSPVLGGSPVMLATTNPETSDLMILGSDLVWTETSPATYVSDATGVIRRMPLGGGAPSLLAQGQLVPRHLSAGSGWIVWTETGPDQSMAGYGRIARMPEGGGPSETAANGVSDLSPPIALTEDDVIIGDRACVKRLSRTTLRLEYVACGGDEIIDIVTDGTKAYWLTPGGDILSVALAGGPLVTLGPDNDRARGSGPLRIRLVAGNIYWTSSVFDVYTVPAAGGPTREVVRGLPYMGDFDVDAQAFFWSEHDTGRVRGRLLAGGQIWDVGGAHFGQDPPVALDGRMLYWADPWGVYKDSTAGGAPTTVLSTVDLTDFLHPMSIAVDPTHVYFTAPPHQAIARVRK